MCWWCLVCSHRWPRLGAAPQCGCQPPGTRCRSCVAHRAGAFVVVHCCQPLGGFQRCSPPCGASFRCSPLVVLVKHRLSAPDGASTGRLTNGWGVHPFRVAAIAAMGGCGDPVVLTPVGLLLTELPPTGGGHCGGPVPRWVVSIVYPRDSGALRYPRPGGHPPCPGGEFTFGAAGPGRPERTG